MKQSILLIAILACGYLYSTHEIIEISDANLTYNENGSYIEASCTSTLNTASIFKFHLFKNLVRHHSSSKIITGSDPDKVSELIKELLYLEINPNNQELQKKPLAKIFARLTQKIEQLEETLIEN